MVKEEIQERFTASFLELVNVSCILNNKKERMNGDERIRKLQSAYIAEAVFAYSKE